MVSFTATFVALLLSTAVLGNTLTAYSGKGCSDERKPPSSGSGKCVSTLWKKDGLDFWAESVRINSINNGCRATIYAGFDCNSQGGSSASFGPGNIGECISGSRLGGSNIGSYKINC